MAILIIEYTMYTWFTSNVRFINSNKKLMKHYALLLELVFSKWYKLAWIIQERNVTTPETIGHNFRILKVDSH